MTALPRNRRGVSSIEYGLIAMIVSIAIIFGVMALSGSLDNFFSKVAEAVDNAVAS